MNDKEAKTRSASEWVGGRLLTPMYITEGEPYRPEVILWMELPEGFVVGTHLMNPAKPDLSFGESLVRTMQHPMVGAPRRPPRIRVADASLAAEVRVVVGDGAHVTVSPTPELHELVRLMSEHIGEREAGETASYFEAGRVSPGAVEGLFQAARLLFGIAPWKFIDDSQVARVDIPKLGVDGACLSVIGALGEHFGIVLFPSFAGWEAFSEVEPPEHPGDPIDLGTGYLSLSFERGADLPDAMRREVASHAWPVDGPNAYPRVECRDRDGMLRPLVERDVRIISACATSFSAFCIKHRHLFERGSGAPVCESYSDADDLTVRFTVPYDAYSLFEIEESPTHTAVPLRVGRNAPCPCGSGKKYKKCCLGADDLGQRQHARAENVHERDARLVADIYQWAGPRLGKGWAAALADVADQNVTAQLLVCWCAYHAMVDGRRVVDRFLEARKSKLSDDDRAWLASQHLAWLSIWEVVACNPGIGVHLKDLLSGEVREVREASGSKTLVKRDAVLARVVDHGGVSVLCGMFPRALPPSEAAEVVRRVRGRLRLKRAVPVERLRGEAIGRYMVRLWDEAVDDLVERARIPPKFTNTDGDDLLLITDHFELDAMARPQVEERLMKVEGAHLDERNDAVTRIDFRRQRAGDEMTIIGHAELSDVALTLETNSLERADRLRQLVENSCGALLRHRTRESTDPRASRQGFTQPTPEPPGAAQIVRSFKERHYRNWADEALPALNGQTPRQAMRSAAGRERVDVLLKDMENRESRLPEDHRYDFKHLRRELGLEP